ncbi:MAG: carbon starvation CstA family protein [Planctomycetota bacterium]|jgi:carbon starvation protein
MSTLLIAIGALVAYLVAYHTYGRWLARRIFRLDAEADVPSVTLRDDQDYMPTPKAVVFGHHFTSIAGTGPIVGPAIAVMWGWLPALLWVLFGSILIGAVHDFGSLVVSMRNRGQTVGEIAGRVLNPRVRLLFLLTLFMALTIVLAIFGVVIATVFRMYPAAIVPCIVQIPLALVIGAALHRRGAHLLAPSIIALGIMYVTVLYGNVGPLGAVNSAMAEWSTFTWVLVLLGYASVASVLPIWTLLQPRDYINSLQLLTALGLVLAGLVVAAFAGGAAIGTDGARPTLEIVAPAVQMHPPGAPIIFPFLFITIACGAISGFHCLVSSGTSSKQIRCETDAQFIGYGSMLTEGFLATLVILACVAGLGLGVAGPEGTTLFGEAAWTSRYGSWGLAGGLPAKVGAFVDGAANFLRALGLSPGAATALMGVLVASFAGTTLDTACRLQRYVIQELAGTFVGADADGVRRVGANPVSWLTTRHGATLLAVTFGAAMAAINVKADPGFFAVLATDGMRGGWSWLETNGGLGGMILWPMFGATNQLLGGLAFLVIGFWLRRKGLPHWFLVPPMVFMLIMPAWAMLWQLFDTERGWLFADDRNWVLIGVAIGTLAIEAWMVVEGIRLWPKVAAERVVAAH